MNINVKLKQIILVGGDLIVLYLSLLLTLVFEFGNPLTADAWNSHLEPFTFLFVIWLLIFYIAGLYDIHHLKNNLLFWQKFGSAIVTGTAVAIVGFYLLPLGITPKTNLLIFVLSFTLLGYLWRRFHNKLLSASTPSTNILLIGDSNAADAIATQIKSNPQLGYRIGFQIKNTKLDEQELDHISQIIIAEKINLIVIPNHLKKDSRSARAIYRNLALGIEILDTASFYEIVFGKTPLEELEESWFLENITTRHRFYEIIKQPVEIVLALILALILLPLLILIAILIALTSIGPVIYKQTRVGQYGTKFVLYKFRTMVRNAEQGKAQWSQPDDQRVTFIGRILRRSHLDELPQLFNIIKGEAAFVGPRPERPEFVNQLKEVIPFYDLRHLVRPGVAGWAQLNYRYGASVADAREKLQYEIYYIKNRSFWLDLSIVLKTIKMLIVKN